MGVHCFASLQLTSFGMHNILYTNSEANNNKQDESIRLLRKKKRKKNTTNVRCIVWDLID